MVRAAALIVLLVTACGGTPAATPNVAQIASDYATQLAGAERPLGCSGAAPGRESEEHPGCIWSVAFAACHEGLTGEQLGPRSIEEEFPTEPALQELHYRAVQECASRR